MTLLLSIFLGLVQGIAEFLPISSSGHLSILHNLFSLGSQEGEHFLFDIFLHLATMFSIIFVYRKELKAMISDALTFLRMRSESDIDEPVVMRPPARALLFVFVGTIPMVLAAIFMRTLSRLFLHIGFIGFALIVTGGLLFVSEKYITKGNKTEKTMTLGDAIIIGLAQAVAVIPGLSRSGTTISVGLSRGLSASFAVRYSLLLSIPAVFGSMIVSLFSAIRGGFNFSLFPVYLIGFIVAAVTGFFAIQLIRRLITKGGFGKIAFYCWGVGFLAIILSFIL